MKFDTIIVGGGLSSLVCGISLQRGGKRCLIVSAGQNALHFSSGTFGLLGRLPDGTTVTEPLKALASLPDEHPYSKIGPDRVAGFAAKVPAFFSSCGIDLCHAPCCGDDSPVNGYRLTPMGTLKPAWLAMKDIDLLPSKDVPMGTKALIVNFAGFLDFNTRFIAEGLERRGCACRIEGVKIGDVENLRKNPTEMRSVGIARIMDREENWKRFAHEVQSLVKGEDLVILPEVFGLGDQVITSWLREMIPAKVMFVGTMPPSVPGIRTQMHLKKAFEAEGGTFLAGDTAFGPVFDGDRVCCIHTVNLGSVNLEADHFVLASGNLFGKGLEASPERITEPVFDLDTDYIADRESWCDPDFFAKQAYAGFGVVTDSRFRAVRKGRTLENLYVAGAEVGGCNPLFEGSGAGIAIMTAMDVEDRILSE